LLSRMDDINKLLLVRGKPKADESFIGYVVRLTEQNKYNTPLWILKMARLMSGQPRYSFNSLLSEEGIVLLAKLTDIDISHLESITYVPSDDQFNCYMFFDNIVPRHGIRLSHPKICPECLLESPYCRRIWELSLVTTCPRHKCLLVDECSSCGKRITWIRKSVCACSCNFDWRESLPVTINESELTLTRHVHQLCGLPIDKAYMLDTNTYHARGLSLHNLFLALLFIAGQYKGRLATTGRDLVPFGRNKDFHALFIEAFSVFDDWPSNYYKFLDEIRERQTSVPLNRQRQKSVLYKEFGKFYIDLFKTLSEKQFDFIKKGFTEYLIEKWESFYTSPFSQKQYSIASPNGKYVSKNDAKRLLEIFDEQINQLIKAGKLKSIVQSKGKKRLIFVDLADIARFRQSS